MSSKLSMLQHAANAGCGPIEFVHLGCVNIAARENAARTSLCRCWLFVSDACRQHKHVVRLHAREYLAG